METTIERRLDDSQIDASPRNYSVGIRNPFIRELIECKGQPYCDQVIYHDTTWHQRQGNRPIK